MGDKSHHLASMNLIPCHKVDCLKVYSLKEKKKSLNSSELIQSRLSTGNPATVAVTEESSEDGQYVTKAYFYFPQQRHTNPTLWGIQREFRRLKLLTFLKPNTISAIKNTESLYMEIWD